MSRRARHKRPAGSLPVRSISSPFSATELIFGPLDRMHDRTHRVCRFCNVRFFDLFGNQRLD